MPLARRSRKASFRAAAWLCCARRRLSTSLKLEGDEQIGVNIIAAPAKSRFARSCGNAGYEGAIVIEKIRANKDANFGFNAATGEYEDLVKAGVIDPTKVTRSALQNAASISALMLTTEAMICEIPEKKSARAGGPAATARRWTTKQQSA